MRSHLKNVSHINVGVFQKDNHLTYFVNRLKAFHFFMLVASKIKFYNSVNLKGGLKIVYAIIPIKVKHFIIGQ